MTAKYLIRLTALAATLFCAAACIYPFEVELSKSGEWPLVVDGDLLIGATTVLNLSHVRPFKADPGEFQQFSASAYIEGEDGSKVYNSEAWNSRTGAEFSLFFDTSQLRPDQRYRLHLTTYGEQHQVLNTYESDWLTPCSAPTIDDLNYSYHPEIDQFWIGLSMHCSGEHYFRWSFTETWEYHSDIHSSLEFVPWHFDESEGKYTAGYRYASPDLYYCWSTVSSSQINIFSTINQTDDRFEDLAFHIIRLNDKRLQILYRITVQLQAISEDAYKYWHTIQESSEGQGSIFSPTPSQTASNIHCTSDPAVGVTGYLNAAVPATAVMYYDNAVERYYKPGKPYPSQLDTLEANDLAEADKLFHSSMLPSYALYMGLTDSPTHYVWDSAICIDCRRQGGTKTKPEDWPNNHE